MKPVKWGIISTANIGVAKVIPGMLKSKDVEIVLARGVGDEGDPAAVGRP